MTTMYDCIIIGGGPAGLNAALVLGRAKRKVLIIDDGNPRNKVTHESHGYLTRDRIKPAEFRRIAYEEVLRYPTVEHMAKRAQVMKQQADDTFSVQLLDGNIVYARKLLITTGLKEAFPALPGLKECYGNSVFNCPFCDGWEMQHHKLAVIAGPAGVMHLTKMLYAWNRELIVFTNGLDVLDQDQLQQLERHHIPVMTTQIAALQHQDGQLKAIELEDGTKIERSGGFIVPELQYEVADQNLLPYEVNDHGGIVTDMYGMTTVKGVYSAGDVTISGPSQLIIAAAAGSRTGAMIHGTLMEEEWAVVD